VDNCCEYPATLKTTFCRGQHSYAHLLYREACGSLTGVVCRFSVLEPALFIAARWAFSAPLLRLCAGIFARPSWIIQHSSTALPFVLQVSRRTGLRRLVYGNGSSGATFLYLCGAAARTTAEHLTRLGSCCTKRLRAGTLSLLCWRRFADACATCSINICLGQRRCCKRLYALDKHLARALPHSGGRTLPAFFSFLFCCANTVLPDYATWLSRERRWTVSSPTRRLAAACLLELPGCLCHCGTVARGATDLAAVAFAEEQWRRWRR